MRSAKSADTGIASVPSHHVRGPWSHLAPKAEVAAVSYHEEDWVELPDEFEEHGRCAKLRRWLFGMRQAASGWEDDYPRRLTMDGFRRGRAASTISSIQKRKGESSCTAMTSCSLGHGFDIVS